MKIFSTAAHEPLAVHLKEIAKSKKPSIWRCMMAELSREFYKDPNLKNIALNYIEEHFKKFEVYEFAFYWMKTGHVFILVQGRLSEAHSIFEGFLDFISEGQDEFKPEIFAYDMGRQAELVSDVFEAARHQLKTLPVNDTRSEPLKVIQSQKRDKNAERMMRVKPVLLVIEDERMTQAFIDALLKPYCEIITADSIAQGRNLYETVWPNIVFMDIELPDGDGQALTEEIYKQDPEAHVVMVSANISIEKVQKCRESGAKGFIAKPVTSDKERLLAMVDQYRQSR
ncbi:MAG: response regulator [Pseudomonadota bacterium]